MKTPTVLLPLALCLLYSGQCFSQSSLYTQSNKEIELNYGVIADEDLALISEIEKIKYEFRYSERTHVTAIDANYQTTLDITVDSNGYEQPWMDLAKRFHYDANGISYYDKQGALMNSIMYTQEQQIETQEIAEYTRENGYHPGIESFPVINEEDKSLLAEEGITLQFDADSTIITLFHPTGEKDVYDSQNLSISHEWIDEDGLKNIETTNYQPYLEYKGYLPMMQKHEKFLYSINGPCITDVKLILFTDYQIQDFGALIDKATKQYRAIIVYPNPNNGIFTVETTLPNDEQIISTRISNIITGDWVDVNSANAKIFVADIHSLAPGHYSIRVTTNQSTLSTHFYKQ